MNHELHFERSKPEESLFPFVESFWMLENETGSEKEIAILPDGRVELTFSKSEKIPIQIVLSGIETQPQRAIVPANTTIFSVSLKLPAVEILFGGVLSDILDDAVALPDGFWNLTSFDFRDFDNFKIAISQKLQSLFPDETESRRRKLFTQLYDAKGATSVAELCGNANWSSRQVNRYFNQTFGLSLKKYCNILRFRVALDGVANGKLSPNADFADQSHFIKEVKRFSGVAPRDLLKNANGRFIQLSPKSPS